MKLLITILKKIVPHRLYKLMANGFIIVPRYYKTIIDDTECYMNLSSEDNINKDILLIRKFAHILDKGLHRADAQPGHSHTIYIELKSLIDKLSKSDYITDPSYLWAKDKLSIYESLQKNPKEFKHLEGEPTISPINYDTISQLIKQRRSCRDFKDQEISDSILYKICDVVNWAASSCDKQPLKLFVTNNPYKAKECLKCCKGGTGFSEYIPSFWAITANCRAYVWPSEIMLPTLDGSLGLQNMFLAAHTLGISGTILSWAQKSTEEETLIRYLLSIPEDYIIICCAVMGYPSSYFQTPVRKLPEISILK